MEQLGQEAELKVQKWVNDESAISMLVDEDPAARVRAGRSLTEKTNFSIGKKPGFFGKPDGVLAVLIDLSNTDGLHPTAKNISGNFFAKVGMAMDEALSAEGILGISGRVGNSFVNSKNISWNSPEVRMKTLENIIKETKLKGISVVCPEMELLQWDSLPKVINEFLTLEKLGVSLKGGINGVRNDISRRAKFLV